MRSGKTSAPAFQSRRSCRTTAESSTAVSRSTARRSPSTRCPASASTRCPLSSKAPPYSPHRDAPERGDNIGLVLTNLQSGRRVFYAPGLGAIEPHVLAAMREADLLLVDGTLWTGDEMIRLGLSNKTSADMGHLPQSGAGGMIETLDSLGAKRKVLIHINNTNPILIEDGPERRMLGEHGIEVAYDAMSFEL
ncbi:coenzyme PQQ biosynthesis protein B [Paraburkholderia sp. 32]